MVGQGPITGVRVNGRRWSSFDGDSVLLPYDRTPPRAAIQILRGQAKARSFPLPKPDYSIPVIPRDSALPVTKPAPVIVANQLPLRIGADSDGGSLFNGDFARVCLFRRALTPAEIATLARPDPGPLLTDAALLGRWSFAPSTDGSFANSVGPLSAAKAVGKVETTDSPFGKTLHLSGEGYLEVPNSPALDLARGATLYALVRPETTQGRLLDKCPVGQATGFTFDTHPGNALRLISDAGSLSYDAKLVPGEWVHLAATVDEHGTSTLYVNGKKVSETLRQAEKPDFVSLLTKVDRMHRFHQTMQKAGRAESYEAAHARLAVRSLAVTQERARMLATGKLVPLPDRSQVAADQLYLDTVARLCNGLEKALDGYANSKDPSKQQISRIWKSTRP